MRTGEVWGVRKGAVRTNVLKKRGNRQMAKNYRLRREKGKCVPAPWDIEKGVNTRGKKRAKAEKTPIRRKTNQKRKQEPFSSPTERG